MYFIELKNENNNDHQDNINKKITMIIKIILISKQVSEINSCSNVDKYQLKFIFIVFMDLIKWLDFRLNKRSKGQLYLFSLNFFKCCEIMKNSGVLSNFLFFLKWDINEGNINWDLICATKLEIIMCTLAIMVVPLELLWGPYVK